MSSRLRLVRRSFAGRVQSLNRAASGFEGIYEEDVPGPEIRDQLSQRFALRRTEPEVPEWVDEEVLLIPRIYRRFELGDGIESLDER
jgi:hypothetical protein